MSYLGPKVYIDLHQLKKNYQIVKKEVGDIPIMATVKANAYGHGAVEVSRVLEEQGIPSSFQEFRWNLHQRS